jgi:hypothetical protein
MDDYVYLGCAKKLLVLPVPSFMSFLVLFIFNEV